VNSADRVSRFFNILAVGGSGILLSHAPAIFAAGEAINTVSVTDFDYSVPQRLAMGVLHRSYDFAKIEGTKAELAMNYTQVKLPLGKYDFMGGFFVPTQSIEKTSFRFNDLDESNQDSYTLKTQLMFVQKLDDSWTRILQVTPSIHSDLEAMDEDAFSLMGLAIWRYKSTENSSWVMGVGVNRLFGTYKPIPLLSYQYQLADRVQLDAGFPVTKAEYRWRDNWSAYTSIAPIGGNWRYENKGTRTSVVEEGEERLSMSYTSWVAALGLRYRIKGHYWASLAVGQSFARRLNLDADDSGKEDIDIADTPMLMFSFGYHP
jgi:hypothetical protein